MFALILRVFEYLTPLSTLTYLSSKIADAKAGAFTQWLIKKFVATYKINLEECAEPDLTKYETFNSFFIRQLKEGARPIDQNCKAISPVDGTVGQADLIKAGRLIQAKGIDYSLMALLGGNQTDAEQFKTGAFACIYLSPANYHRIHMPLDGKLIKTIHIPGRHFPVGKKNVSNMPDLFTKNERLVCFFETKAGIFSVVMVGAALVGSIATPWAGTIKRTKGIQITNYVDKNLEFKRGDEIGLFKFGSTVICVWPQSLGILDQQIQPGKTMKMGEPLISADLIK